VLNPTKILADALGNHLEKYYIAMFGPEEPLVLPHRVGPPL